MKKALIIEDDANILGNLVDLLEEEGFVAIGAPNGTEGVAAAFRERPDVILCDVLMPAMDGYGVLGAVRANPETTSIPFIFLTAKADRGDIRLGMNLGADDYLTKPFSNAELLESVRTRIARSDAALLANQGRSSPVPPLGKPKCPSIVVSDPAMLALYEQVALVARDTISVLLLGETGVGKEVVAQAIHSHSARAQKPFVALNCAALSESLLESELFGYEKGSFTGATGDRQGLIQAASGGTLFLDEIGDLPSGMQAKLLRVLQEKEIMRVGGRSPIKVDVRFLAATHRDLEADVQRGAFRQDLYYRLRGFPLTIPPLRERRSEIVKLAEAFVTNACSAASRVRRPSLSDSAIAVLGQYDWPGNIRELRNAVERAVVLCAGDTILSEHFDLRCRSHPPSAPPEARRSLVDEKNAVEERHIRDALARFGGNQTKTAEFLGISRRTLVTRLGEYDLPRPRKK